MKKSLAVIVGVIALAGCTKTVYQTAPTEAPTSTTKAPATTIKPRPTTTISSYEPDYSGSSQSEEQLFLDSLYSLQPMASVVDSEILIETGYMICAALVTGSSADDIYTVMLEATNYDESMFEFNAAVLAATLTVFCPDQAYKFDI